MNKLIQRLFEFIVLIIALFCLFNPEAREFILGNVWWVIIGSIPILGGYEFLKYITKKSQKSPLGSEGQEPVE